MQILTVEEVTSLDPEINALWAKLYVDAANSVLQQLTTSGGLVRAEVLPQIKLLVVRAVQRSVHTKPWLKAETIGPYQATYQDLAATLFTSYEMNVLQALLEVPQAALGGGGGPRSGFPAAPNVEHLFAQPQLLQISWAAGAEYDLGQASDPVAVVEPAPSVAVAPSTSVSTTDALDSYTDAKTAETTTTPTVTPAPTVRVDYSAYFA